MKVNNIIHRSVLFAMTVFLFSGFVGFNVDFHYCGGELKSYSFFAKAESCHQKKGVFCPIHQKVMVMGGGDKFDCCKNESVYFQSDQDLQFQHTAPAINLQFEKQLIPAVFSISFFQKTKWEKHFHPPPEPDPPPQQRQNIQVWHQSFLC